MLTNSWKVGDFFYVPEDPTGAEYYGVFTEHGSILVACSEHGNEIVCSTHGITKPIPNSIPLENKILYSNNLITILYTIHASSVGKLPFGHEAWPIIL